MLQGKWFLTYEGSLCLHLQGQANQDCVTLKMKAIQSRETLKTTHPMTLKKLGNFSTNSQIYDKQYVPLTHADDLLYSQLHTDL